METTVQEVSVTGNKAIRAAAFKALRAELAASVAQAKAARAAIHEKKCEPSSEERGRELQALWAEKRYDRDTRRELALALAYLKGRAYAACERKAVVAPYTGGVAKMLTRVGIPTTASEVGAWVTPPKVAEAA